LVCHGSSSGSTHAMSSKANGRSSHAGPPILEVELPAGGKLMLHGIDEVAMWTQSRERYVKDYALSQQNDLILEDRGKNQRT